MAEFSENQEITPEMVEAGEDVLLLAGLLDDDGPDSQIVEWDIFKAMTAAETSFRR